MLLRSQIRGCRQDEQSSLKSHPYEESALVKTAQLSFSEEHRFLEEEYQIYDQGENGELEMQVKPTVS